MKRSPLKRRTKLKPRRERERRSGRKRDTAYMLWVKTLPCCAWTALALPGQGGTCLNGGPIEAHHAGVRAAGRKASDDTCIPLCSRHHREWHWSNGIFARLAKENRRAWADARIAETQALWARRNDRCAS